MTATRKPKGMKADELRAAAECARCRKKIGAAKLPFFYRVRIERYGIKRDAVMRHSGLEMMLGGAAPLAEILGPNEDLAIEVADPAEVTICDDCGMSDVMVAVLFEIGQASET